MNCPKCGTIIREDWTFCMTCNARINEDINFIKIGAKSERGVKDQNTLKKTRKMKPSDEPIVKEFEPQVIISVTGPALCPHYGFENPQESNFCGTILIMN